MSNNTFSPNSSPNPSPNAGPYLNSSPSPLEVGPTLTEKILRKLSSRLAVFALASIFVSVPVSVFGAVVVTDTTPTSFTCSVASKSIFSDVATGDDIVIVPVAHHSFVTTMSVTFNGVPMTLGTSTLISGRNVELWYMISPPVGTYTVTANMSGAGACITMGASSLSDVDVSGTFNYFINNQSGTNVNYTVYASQAGSFMYGIFDQLNADPISSTNGTILSQADGVHGVGMLHGNFLTAIGNNFIDATYSTSNSSVLVTILLNAGGGGGGGGGTPTATTTVTNVSPASLYSSSNTIIDPVSTSTYSFVSPISGSSTTQGGVLFVSHISSVTPTVTWGGRTMIEYAVNDTALFGYKISLYHITAPASTSPIVISGITASSTNFIQASVWNNGNLVTNTDQQFVFAGTDASVDLAGLVSPIGIVGAWETPTPSLFTKQTVTNIFSSATNTSFTFNTISRSCNGFGVLTDCPIGYNPTGFFGVEYANIIAIGLYSTSSNVIPNPSGTTPIIYESCETFDLSCYITNAFQYLFIPSSDSVTRFRSLTLASSTPFSYAYDVGNVYNELFNTSTTTVLGITVPFKYYGNSSSTITLISASMIESVPYVGFIRTLISWLLWFMFAQLVYYQILKVHNKEHTA